LAISYLGRYEYANMTEEEIAAVKKQRAEHHGQRFQAPYTNQVPLFPENNGEHPPLRLAQDTHFTATPDAYAVAREKGFTGDTCPECGNFTMVRNGTCLKCQTCGATTGCS
jgi:ribonucleoside-diphosphate reductase alpha chain